MVDRFFGVAEQNPTTYNRGMKPAAVMDTSFWTAAVHVRVDAYLPLFFARPILVPNAVRAEIEREGDPENSRWLQEDRQRFRLWLEDGRVRIVDPAKPYRLYGPGEAACLGLALERGDLWILVNDRRPYEEALRLGLQAASVPELILQLVIWEKIPRFKAESMLDVLEDANTVSPGLIEMVREQLSRIR